MLTSQEVKKTSGVHDATVAMGTPMNLDLLRSLGFDAAALAEATPNDLVIAVDCNSAESAKAARAAAKQALSRKAKATIRRRGACRADQPRFRSPGSGRRQSRGHFPAGRLRGARGPQGAGERPARHAVLRQRLPRGRDRPQGVEPAQGPADDGARLRHRHHQRHAALFRQCRQARPDRRHRRLGHRHPGSHLPHRPRRIGRQPGDRRRRSRPQERTGRRRDDADGHRSARRRRRHQGHRHHLQAAGESGRGAGGRGARARRQARRRVLRRRDA